MKHRAWMLPEEDRIERRLSSTPRDSSLRPAKRKTEGAKRTTVLAACVAVAVLASGAFLLTPGTRTERQLIATPGDSPGLGTETPHPIIGYCNDTGGNPLPDCIVTVTYWEDGSTSYSGETTSDENGLYQFDISEFPGEWEAGKYVEVEAVNEALQISGYADGYTTEAFYDHIDVTLNVVIPEFPMVITPVVGILALFAIARIRRKKEEA